MYDAPNNEKTYYQAHHVTQKSRAVALLLRASVGATAKPLSINAYTILACCYYYHHSSYH
jgi:hypothetical protein